jgi:hypothetical protein
MLRASAGNDPAFKLICYRIPQTSRLHYYNCSDCDSAYGGGERLYRFVVGKLEEKRPLGRPNVDGRIIIRSIFRTWDEGVWTELSWLRIVRVGGHF